jgi:tetratricopeptide (TPR) repeat protein
MSATIAETPVARRFQKDPTAPKAAQDSIALDKPIGEPSATDLIAFAQVAERQGNIEQARAHFRKALSQWPNDLEVLRATARLEDRQGRMDVAECLYQRAVTADPQQAATYNDLGLCLARSGKLEQSAQSLELAICLQPDKALYRNNAALVLVELHQEQKALAHLSAVHTPAASNYNLGQLLVTRGRTPQAVPYFQAAIEQDPALEAARVALAQATGMPLPPTHVAEQVPVTPPEVAPAYGPQIVPQQADQQPSFPATARGPAWDASTATARPAMPVARAQLPRVTSPATMVPSQPPAVVQAPPASYPATQAAPAYQTATAPRYLPPVQSSGTLVR